MDAGTIKILALVAYGVFVLVSKAVKASRNSSGPGGSTIPQGAPRKPRPLTGPVQTRPRAKARALPRAPARVAPPKARPRPGPVPPKKAPVRQEQEEGPRHDASHPVQSHLQAPKKDSLPPPPVEAAPSPAHALLSSAADLRRAVLMAEILGRPVSAR